MDDLCTYQQQEWLEMVGKYYEAYISRCKCDPDECECLSFKNFEYDFLDEFENQYIENFEEAL